MKPKRGKVGDTVLGPAPCSECRKPVVWDGYIWQNPDHTRHVCYAEMIEAGLRDADEVIAKSGKRE